MMSKILFPSRHASRLSSQQGTHPKSQQPTEKRREKWGDQKWRTPEIAEAESRLRVGVAGKLRLSFLRLKSYFFSVAVVRDSWCGCALCMAMAIFCLTVCCKLSTAGTAARSPLLTKLLRRGQRGQERERDEHAGCCCGFPSHIAPAPASWPAGQ